MLQIGLSYFQHKNYKEVLNEIKKMKTGYLGVGIAKAKFKVGKGVVTFLVTDENKVILDYQEMSGYTVFARFKRNQRFVGKKAEDIRQSLKGKQQITAFNQALTLIDKELLKMEG